MEIKRIRTNAGITQKEVARVTGMTSQAVLRYEQGLYEELSPKLLEYYGDISSDDSPNRYENIAAQYQMDRMKIQRDASHAFNSLPPLRMVVGEHPFCTFRKAITSRAVGKDSRMAFCILLALNPAVVYTYDTGKQPTMPSLISQGLRNAGLNGDYLTGLEELGAIYYERSLR